MGARFSKLKIVERFPFGTMPTGGASQQNAQEQPHWKGENYRNKDVNC